MRNLMLLMQYTELGITKTNFRAKVTRPGVFTTLPPSLQKGGGTQPLSTLPHYLTTLSVPTLDHTLRNVNTPYV